VVWHIEVLLPAAAIDDRRRTYDLRTCGARNVDRLASRFPGCDDVLDYQNTFAWCQRESAAQHQLAVLAFCKDGADAKPPPDLLTNHDSAEGRGQNSLRGEPPYTLGNFNTACLGLRRVLEYQGALQIPGTV
jgi:hypothetical protein